MARCYPNMLGISRGTARGDIRENYVRLKSLGLETGVNSTPRSYNVGNVARHRLKICCVIGEYAFLDCRCRFGSNLDMAGS